MHNQIEKWDFIEITLTHTGAPNPYLDVNLAATFTHTDHQIRVSGFCDGDATFKLRFMPDREGAWRYVTHSNIPALDGQTGEFTCTAPSAGNHGPVRVANTLHFAYADGTPYIPVGTTCYVWNLQGDALEEQTLQTLDAAPFNKMRMSVFPKRYAFNRNEPPCYPFPGQVTRAWDPTIQRAYRDSQPPQFWDFSRFNPAYFQHLEKRILDLRARSIEADLIIFHPYDWGAWGFDRLPIEVNDRLLHYLTARLGAFRNLWWSFANEYDLFVGRTMPDWDHYMALVQQIDPYDHLRSIHNCGTFYDHRKPWVTHCSVQHHDIRRVPTWQKRYNKPIVIDECGYEGDIHMHWGDLSAEELVLRFWLGFTQGGYVGHGETYVNAEEVLWWSKGGQLRGQSVPRIAFLRAIFEHAPDLTPVEKFETEDINFMDPEVLARVFGQRAEDADPIARQGGLGSEAGGYNTEKGYYLFYYGTHQPGARPFNFPAGTYRIDLLDTWHMTIETVAEQASGETSVPMPARQFIALRIQRN